MKYLVQENGQFSGLKTILTLGVAIVFVKLVTSGIVIEMSETATRIAFSSGPDTFDYSGAAAFIGVLIAGIVGRKAVTNGKAGG